MVAAGRFRLAMAIAILAALLAAGAAAALIDVRPAVEEGDSAEWPNSGTQPAGGPSAGPDEAAEVKTDREIEEEIARRTALVQVKLGLDAALGVPARIVLLALAMFLLGRYIGGEPTFRRALAAASVGALPWAVRSLIAAAAAWRQGAIAPSELDSLVAGALPLGAHRLAPRLAAGVDLFSLWSVLLCSFGLAAAAGIGRVRGAVAVTIGFILLLMLRTVGVR